jgi:hypothetical protein
MSRRYAVSAQTMAEHATMDLLDPRCPDLLWGRPRTRRGAQVWQSMCGRYEIVHLPGGFGCQARIVAKEGAYSMLIAHSQQGSTYAKYFATLAQAMDAVEGYHRKTLGLKDFNTNSPLFKETDPC